MKRSAAAFILLFSIAAISFCVSSCKNQEKLPGSHEKVRIGYSFEPSNALYIIAEAKGFFSHEGLTAEIKTYPSGKLAMEGMFRGEVDLSMSADTPIVFNSFERRDFSIIASTAVIDRYHKIIARKDKGILKPEDLRNKRIATQKASAVHYYLYAFLQSHGLAVKDVSLVFKQPDDLPDLLSKGLIDAFSMREPFISKAENLLGSNAIVFAESGLYLRTDYLTAKTDFVNSKSRAIKKVLMSLIRAEEFIKKYPEQAIKLVCEKLGVRETEIKDVWKDMIFEVSLDQADVIALEGIARWAIQSKLTEKTEMPNYLDFIYTDALKAIKPEAVTIIK